MTRPHAPLRPRSRSAVALAAAAGAAAGLSMLAGHARAASSTWDTNTAGAWNETNPTPWAGDIVADGAGFTATFSADISADRIITLDVARTIGNLSFSDTTNTWTLNGPSVLTLSSVGEGTPQVDVTV